MRVLSVISLALFGPCCLVGAEADPSDVAPAQLLIEIKLFEQKTPEAAEKVYANPTLVATVGRPFRFHSGGAVRSKHGGEDLEIGTRVRGKVARAADNELKLLLTVSVGNVCSVPGDDADVVRTETLDIRTKMASQETKKFRFSEIGWCSISVESFEEASNARRFPHANP